MTRQLRPTLLYRDGRFVSGESLSINEQGLIVAADPTHPAETIDLSGKALLPGFVNAHSHAFQRLIRGKAESRAVSGRDFWSWRNTMYQAAAHLSPEEMYDVARMCFLEMVRAGITTVGEFHYVHNQPDGTPYEDANLLARQVIAAAQSVGLRIVLLRSAYLRSGFGLPPDPGQRRFYESAEAFLASAAELLEQYGSSAADVRVGIAPHSIRAVPLPHLRAIVGWARERQLPVHMHIAEQLAENDACQRESSSTPVALLAREGLLGRDLVAVHAIHLSAEERSALAEAGVTVCSCPTTERNLGDGIVAADELMRLGVRHALGSDSQAQIDPLEDARELDYHLRLAQQQRAILDQIPAGGIALPIASRLLECATVNGAHALGIASGTLQPGEYGDVVSVDLDDLSIAGRDAQFLLPLVVFGMQRSAIRDVMVNGRFVLRDGHHPLEDEIVSKYQELCERVWAPGWERERMSSV
ncbi:MAG: formimidoylglutamate deiminase [Mucilaginibacter sp.]|nr:formimidoylglutamate deiminase [Mucilaginibacter sp.]